MADCMIFPKDWRDFIKDYSFIDSERVYTNGSELIQVFRVIQLIEHLLKEQPQIVRCKDCKLAFYKEGLVLKGYIFCTKPGTERGQAVKPDNWFCADGKRKEGR